MQLSSGDLLADRRVSYAEMLLESGDANAAADLMRDALTLAPGFAAPDSRNRPPAAERRARH